MDQKFVKLLLGIAALITTTFKAGAAEETEEKPGKVKNLKANKTKPPADELEESLDDDDDLGEEKTEESLDDDDDGLGEEKPKTPAKGELTVEDVRKKLLQLKEVTGDNTASRALMAKAIGDAEKTQSVASIPKTKYKAVMEACEKKIAAAKAKK